MSYFYENSIIFYEKTIIPIKIRETGGLPQKYAFSDYPSRIKEQYKGAKRPVSEISSITRFSASTASPAVIVQLFTY
jgi:hypothetical protein